jgi:plastocyanin
MRRSMRASLAGVALGGLVITGCGGGGESSNGSTPSTADVVVRGDDALKFDQAQYTATAGSVDIELLNDGTQPHTLLVEKVSSFKKLSVSGKGDTDTGKATLDPGTYTIYCDVAGHRSAGMEAKLVVN